MYLARMRARPSDSVGKCTVSVVARALDPTVVIVSMPEEMNSELDRVLEANLDDAARTYAFTMQAVNQPAPQHFAANKIDDSVRHALEWTARAEVDKVIEFREKEMRRIEEAGALMRKNGETDRWFEGADEQVRGVAKGFNGPLAEMLAKESGFWDEECIDTMRHGAKVVGTLPYSGCGEPHEYRPGNDVE